MQDAQISLSGNVGTEVETMRGEGWALSRFRLACTPRRQRQGEWTDLETNWIGINCWGRMAEHVQASLHKGDPVVVVGRLRTSAWVDKEGQRQERLVVEASSLGPDLSRCRSTVERIAAMPRTETTPDGERVDQDTGEVLEVPQESQEEVEG